MRPGKKSPAECEECLLKEPIANDHWRRIETVRSPVNFGQDLPMIAAKLPVATRVGHGDSEMHDGLACGAPKVGCGMSEGRDDRLRGASGEGT